MAGYYDVGSVFPLQFAQCFDVIPGSDLMAMRQQNRESIDDKLFELGKAFYLISRLLLGLREPW